MENKIDELLSNLAFKFNLRRYSKVSRVVRIPAEEAVLLNSREKAPYLLCLEVISVAGAGSEDGSDGGGSDGGVTGGEPEVGANGVPLWSVSPRTSEDGAASSSRAGLAELAAVGAKGGMSFAVRFHR